MRVIVTDDAACDGSHVAHGGGTSTARVTCGVVFCVCGDEEEQGGRGQATATGAGTDVSSIGVDVVGSLLLF
jgi:hypothetical protein